MKVMAIAAHPDDIEIFMFGLLAAFQKRGDEIILCVATDGSAGKIKLNSDLEKIRQQESIEGLRKLGTPNFLHLQDGNLAGSKNGFQQVKDFIYKIEPDLIITHDPFDYHPDHRALSKYVTDAIGFKCPTIFCETLMGINFVPEIYVDITDFFLLKKEAILAHKSQNSEKFYNAIKLANRFRSAQCNAPEKNYAEVYRTSKTFPFTDLRNIIPNTPKIIKFYDNNSKGFL